MEYRLDMGMWNQVFAVPCALADRHLKLAGKEQLQVILWTLRHAGESFSPADMAQSLGMSEDSALDALEYWCDRGLLSALGGDLRPVPQPETAPVRTAAPQEAPAADAPPPASPAAGPSAVEPAAAPEPEKPALPPRKRMVRPDGMHLAARINESESIRFLMQEAEAILGKTLSPAMSTLLLTISDDYGLPPEVTVMLLHYTVGVGKTGTAYIDSVARDWAESGIFTLEAAERKLQDLSERKLAWGKVEAAAGLPKRSPSKKEEDAAYRWVYEWKFTVDMLAAAYERCVDNTGKFSAAYMNKVLERWYKSGIRNLAELAGDEQQKKDGKDKSYDIDELERMSFFDLPEDM